MVPGSASHSIVQSVREEARQGLAVDFALCSMTDHLLGTWLRCGNYHFVSTGWLDVRLRPNAAMPIRRRVSVDVSSPKAFLLGRSDQRKVSAKQRQYQSEEPRIHTSKDTSLPGVPVGGSPFVFRAIAGCFETNAGPSSLKFIL